MRTLKGYLHTKIILGSFSVFLSFAIVIVACSSKNSTDIDDDTANDTKVYQYAFDSPNSQSGACNYNLPGVGLCCRFDLDTAIELESANYYITIRFNENFYARDYDANGNEFGIKGQLWTHIDEDYFYGYVGGGAPGTLKDVGNGYELFTSHEAWINKGRHFVTLTGFLPEQLANGQKDILVYTIYKKGD